MVSIRKWRRIAIGECEKRGKNKELRAKRKSRL